MRAIHEQLNEAVRLNVEGRITTDGAKLPYTNRTDAGVVLARALGSFAGQLGAVVLALPRGGVPVAHEVATALNVPLDVLAVRKMVPSERVGVVLGAMASGGIRLENRDVIETHAISDQELDQTSQAAFRELEGFEAELRGGLPPPKLTGRTVILVDDGLVTGVTIRAAIASARAQGAAKVILAVPIAPSILFDALTHEVDLALTTARAEPLFALSGFYEDFSEVTAARAHAILREAWSAGLEPERVEVAPESAARPELTSEEFVFTRPVTKEPNDSA